MDTRCSSDMCIHLLCRTAYPEAEKQKLTEYLLDPATGKTLSVTRVSECLTTLPTAVAWALLVPVRDSSCCVVSVRLQLSNQTTDFPVVHPDQTCLPTRYVWCALFEYGAQTADAVGIGKVRYEPRRVCWCKGLGLGLPANS